MSSVVIVRATPEDFDGIWEIFRQVISSGDTYIYPPETTKEEARAIWMNNTVPYVAKIGDKIVGICLLRQNKVGLGSHVCNAAFMVHPDHQNKSIGKQMCRHMLAEAKNMGYLAMQFNIVVSTNERAVHLWQAMGFKIVGTIPKAFNHRQKGLVDAYVMHQFL